MGCEENRFDDVIFCLLIVFDEFYVEILQGRRSICEKNHFFNYTVQVNFNIMCADSSDDCSFLPRNKIFRCTDPTFWFISNICAFACSTFVGFPRSLPVDEKECILHENQICGSNGSFSALPSKFASVQCIDNFRLTSSHSVSLTARTSGKVNLPAVKSSPNVLMEMSWLWIASGEKSSRSCFEVDGT